MSITKNAVAHSFLSEEKVEEREQCFIIQPLDNDFKERCEKHFKPAIKEAGLLPYRVDEHYAADQLLKINTIYKEIQKASVCLADITINNPNVWYEFGFADGKEIPVVLICDQEARKTLPFDVNQRDVYFYRSDLSNGNNWLNLRKEITRRIRITLEEAAKRRKTIDGPHEINDQIQNIREKRLTKIRNRQLPIELLDNAPTVVLHIIPSRRFSRREQIDFKNINPHELQVPVSGHRRTNMDGIYWYNLGELDSEYAQLFQQTGDMEYVGSMEYVWTFRIPDIVAKEHQQVLPSLEIMCRLIRVLRCYTENLVKFNFGRPPWHLFLGLSLLNVKNYFLAPKTRVIPINLVPADRSDLIFSLDERKISNGDGAIAALYPSLNRLWKAFSYERCLYDENELMNWTNIG